MEGARQRLSQAFASACSLWWWSPGGGGAQVGLAFMHDEPGVCVLHLEHQVTSPAGLVEEDAGGWRRQVRGTMAQR